MRLSSLRVKTIVLSYLDLALDISGQSMDLLLISGSNHYYHTFSCSLLRVFRSFGLTLQQVDRVEHSS